MKMLYCWWFNWMASLLGLCLAPFGTWPLLGVWFNIGVFILSSVVIMETRRRENSHLRLTWREHPLYRNVKSVILDLCFESPTQGFRSPAVPPRWSGAFESLWRPSARACVTVIIVSCVAGLTALGVAEFKERDTALHMLEDGCSFHESDVAVRDEPDCLLSQAGGAHQPNVWTVAQTGRCTPVVVDILHRRAHRLQDAMKEETPWDKDCVEDDVRAWRERQGMHIDVCTRGEWAARELKSTETLAFWDRRIHITNNPTPGNISYVNAVCTCETCPDACASHTLPISGGTFTGQIGYLKTGCKGMFFPSTGKCVGGDQ